MRAGTDKGLCSAQINQPPNSRTTERIMGCICVQGWPLLNVQQLRYKTGKITVHKSSQRERDSYNADGTK